jgi:hypothetical protein
MQVFKAKVKTPPRCKDPPSNEKAHAKKNPKDKKNSRKRILYKAMDSSLLFPPPLISLIPTPVRF